jgi:acetyl esterase/lipase
VNRNAAINITRRVMTVSLLKSLAVLSIGFAAGFPAVLRMFKTILLTLVVVAATDLHAVGSDQDQLGAGSAGVWEPPSGLLQVPIWPNGAPDMPKISHAAETTFEVKKVPGRNYIGVADVTTPTMTIFPPKGQNTGASILVFPGGGFRILAVDIEGTEICDWISAKGMTCVLLKYRVPKSNHYWDKDCKCHITPTVPLALQDAQRAIRLVRAAAKELHLDPDRIGVIGFSAGGYLVAQTSNIFESTYRPVDAADGLSSRPDFAIALYPGHLCRSGGTLDPSIKITKQTPPTFLLQTWDDPVDEICNSTVYARALDSAGVPAEVHLFAKGGHAFGLRRSTHPVSSWPSLVENWLKEIKMLQPDVH